MQEMTILNTKKIMDLYGLSRAETYEILRSRGCPILRGGDGKKYLIEKGAFEDFIRKGGKA